MSPESLVSDYAPVETEIFTQFKELIGQIDDERIRKTLSPFAIWYVVREEYGDVITNRKDDHKYMHDFDKETQAKILVLADIIGKVLFFSDNDNRLHLNMMSKYYPTEEELKELDKKYGFKNSEAIPPGGVRFALPQMLGLLYLNNSIHRQGVKRFFRKDRERDALVQRDLLILSWMCFKLINDGQ